jgi:hypothetical protein
METQVSCGWQCLRSDWVESGGRLIEEAAFTGPLEEMSQADIG